MNRFVFSVSRAPIRKPLPTLNCESRSAADAAPSLLFLKIDSPRLTESSPTWALLAAAHAPSRKTTDASLIVWQRFLRSYFQFYATRYLSRQMVEQK